MGRRIENDDANHEGAGDSGPQVPSVGFEADLGGQGESGRDHPGGRVYHRQSESRRSGPTGRFRGEARRTRAGPTLGGDEAGVGSQTKAGGIGEAHDPNISSGQAELLAPETGAVHAGDARSSHDAGGAGDSDAGVGQTRNRPAEQVGRRDTNELPIDETSPPVPPDHGGGEPDESDDYNARNLQKAYELANTIYSHEVTTIHARGTYPFASAIPDAPPCEVEFISHSVENSPPEYCIQLSIDDNGTKQLVGEILVEANGTIRSYGDLSLLRGSDDDSSAPTLSSSYDNDFREQRILDADGDEIHVLGLDIMPNESALDSLEKLSAGLHGLLPVEFLPHEIATDDSTKSHDTVRLMRTAIHAMANQQVLRVATWEKQNCTYGVTMIEGGNNPLVVTVRSAEDKHEWDGIVRQDSAVLRLASDSEPLYGAVSSYSPLAIAQVTDEVRQQQLLEAQERFNAELERQAKEGYPKATIVEIALGLAVLGRKVQEIYYTPLTEEGIPDFFMTLPIQDSTVASEAHEEIKVGQRDMFAFTVGSLVGADRSVFDQVTSARYQKDGQDIEVVRPVPGWEKNGIYAATIKKPTARDNNGHQIYHCREIRYTSGVSLVFEEWDETDNQENGDHTLPTRIFSRANDDTDFFQLVEGRDHEEYHIGNTVTFNRYGEVMSLLFSLTENDEITP